jgi:carboxylesterase
LEAERSDSAQQVLTKNIWELEQRIQQGKGDPLTRVVLMRAYARQVEAVEESLGIPLEQRSYLKVNERTRDGVLLIHGAAGSPAQLRPLADNLFTAGFTVYGMRLPGHGMPQSALGGTPWQAAITDAESRYRILSTYCQKLYVVGFSFGAAVALHLEATPRPRALVLLAPALFVRTSPVIGWLVRLGLTRSPWVRHKLGWSAELTGAMESARKQTWWYGLPVLAVIAEDDPRISPRSVSFIRGHATHTGTEIVRYKDGGHECFDGSHREELEAAALAFLKRN